MLLLNNINVAFQFTSVHFGPLWSNWALNDKLILFVGCFFKF